MFGFEASSTLSSICSDVSEFSVSAISVAIASSAEWPLQAIKTAGRIRHSAT